MSDLQARLHNEVCLPAGLTACLCGSYARVGEAWAREQVRAAERRFYDLLADEHARYLNLAGASRTEREHRRWSASAAAIAPIQEVVEAAIALAPDSAPEGRR